MNALQQLSHDELLAVAGGEDTTPPATMRPKDEFGYGGSGGGTGEATYVMFLGENGEDIFWPTTRRIS